MISVPLNKISVFLLFQEHTSKRRETSRIKSLLMTAVLTELDLVMPQSVKNTIFWIKFNENLFLFVSCYTSEKTSATFHTSILQF